MGFIGAKSFPFCAIEDQLGAANAVCPIVINVRKIKKRAISESSFNIRPNKNANFIILIYPEWHLIPAIQVSLCLQGWQRLDSY
jgi:hypothetical protein